MYVVSIRYQGKTFNSQTINKDNPSIELIHLCQSQCPELEDIVLSLNEHDEIEIQTTGNTPLIIERYLRKRQCLANHPLVLFNHDTLWIGQNPVHRVDITNIRRVEKTSSRISRVPKNTMLASAAALAIMTIPACKQAPQNPGLVETLCECPDVPCPPPGEPIPACSIGCCEDAQPTQDDADKNTADEQNPTVLPHQEPSGDVTVHEPEDELNDETHHSDPVVIKKDSPSDHPKSVGKPMPMGKCDCSKPCPPPGVEPPTCFGNKCCVEQPSKDSTKK